MEINFVDCPKRRRNDIQIVLKIVSMQVTFTRIQQSSIKSKQNLDIQVKYKLEGKECWLREVFRLIVAAVDEIRETIYEL